MYCLCFLLWCVANFLVHTGGFLAIVFRHSSNGKNFAAIRVGQQALQGSHPAPSACLRCLHDTHLESANVAVDGLPVYGVRSEEHTSELQSRFDLVCRLLLEKKNLR